MRQLLSHQGNAAVGEFRKSAVPPGAAESVDGRTDLIAAISLANLHLLRAWHDLANVSNFNYFLKHPAGYKLEILTALNLAVLAALAWVLFRIRKAKSSRIRTTSAGLIVWITVVGLFRLPGILTSFDCYSFLETLLGPVIWPLSAIAACLLLLRAHKLFPFAKGVLLIISPTILIGIVYIHASVSASPSQAQLADEPSPEPAQAVRSQRVLWVLFDELEDALVFENRPDGLELPAFDELRHRSYYVAARPPADMTRESVLSLILGRTVASVETSNLHPTLHFPPPDPPSGLPLQQTIFARSRAIGHNPAIVGFYHPYSRLFGPVAARHYTAPFADVAPSFRWRAFLNDTHIHQAIGYHLLRALSPWRPRPFQRELAFVRSHHAREFANVRAAAMDVARDPLISFALLHVPIPHPPGIYDRQARKIVSDTSSGYLDNLALADAFLQQLSSEITASGLASRTSLVVTADHPLRHFWPENGFWTAEDERLIRGRMRGFVPLLVTLPGPREPIVSEKPVDLLRLYNLMLALLKGNVSSYQDVSQLLQ